MVSDTEKSGRGEFTAAVNIKLGVTLDDKGSTTFSGDFFEEDTKTPEFIPYSDGDNDEATMSEVD